MRVTAAPPGWLWVKRCADGGSIFKPDDASDRRNPDWSRLADDYRAVLLGDKLTALAEQLAVTPASLEHLGIGWDDCRHLYTFPERDGGMSVIGITTRRPSGGDKRAMKGSRRGLTLPRGLDRSATLLIVEGPSDVAAALSIGLQAVGRPGAKGGGQHLADLLDGWVGEVIVCGENDRNDSGEWPGQDGAIHIATGLTQRLKRPIAWALPPDGAKDLRAWVNAERPDLSNADACKLVGERVLAALRNGATVEAESAQPAGKIATPEPRSPLWRPFPVRELPEILRDFVLTGAESVGCDLSMTALPAISILAGAVGTTRQIHVRGLWYEYPIVWTIVVAKSGTLKSPALDYAARALRDAQDNRFDEYEVAKSAYENAELQYEAAKTDWKRSPGKGKSRGDLPKKPAPPVCVRYIVIEPTVESLIPILAANPRGFLLCKDELGAWLSGFNQYKKAGKGSDLQNWLEMHRGGPVIVDRIARGTIRAPRAAVSVCGTVQPGTLSRLLTTEYFEAGLPARLLLAAPPQKRKRWTDAVPDLNVVNTFGDIVIALTHLEHNPDDGSVALPMTASARAEYIAFYNAFADEQAEADDDALAASFSKIEGYVPRLALIFTLANDPHATAVDGDAMRSAITVGRWFACESQRVYGMLRGTGEERERREVEHFIRESGGTVTVREVQRKFGRRFRTADEAEVALKELVRSGRGRFEHDPTGKAGRPAVRFRLLIGVDTATKGENNGKDAIVSASTLSTSPSDDALPIDADYADSDGSGVEEWVG